MGTRRRWRLAHRSSAITPMTATTGTLNLGHAVLHRRSHPPSTPTFTSRARRCWRRTTSPDPESELWTAMGTLYSPAVRGEWRRRLRATSCRLFRVQRQPAPADDRLHRRSRSPKPTPSSTTTSGRTATRPAISYPSQATTEVWGDGDLTNGGAPGDADDILAAGQIVILNDVKDSTACQEVVDFDARDKIAATKPVAVSRSALVRTAPPRCLPPRMRSIPPVCGARTTVCRWAKQLRTSRRFSSTPASR